MIFSFEVLEVCKLSGYVMLALGLAVLEERARTCSTSGFAPSKSNND